MRLVIIGTTINGEKGYLPFDRLLKKSKFSDATFVIAGDRRAVPLNTAAFESEVEYLDTVSQERFHSSGTIGWNTPRRRPIAWLRALELKPDYILSIDDDNIPPPDYFDNWYRVLTNPVKKIVLPVKNTEGRSWHNYLSSSDASIEIYPRGFPVPFRHLGYQAPQENNTVIPQERIGLWQGISVGDPDIGAETRIVYPQPITMVSDKNYCMKGVWSPYNMQNTLYAKKLFPLPILWPHAGRYDDIYASFVMQKILFNNGMYAHVGDPVNRQDRGLRDTLNVDLPQEIEGYFNAHKIWEIIDNINETEPLRFMEKLVDSDNEIIVRHKEFFSAYRKDIEKIIS